MSEIRVCRLSINGLECEFSALKAPQIFTDYDLNVCCCDAVRQTRSIICPNHPIIFLR